MPVTSAGSALGMEIGKNAAPDGYTFVSAPTAALAVAPLIHQKRPHDIVNDYEFISLFAVTPNVLAVHPALPVKTVSDLIAFSKSRAQTNMASAGPGSQSHLTGVLLANMGKFPAVHIPYKGGGASVAAVVAGESQWTMTPAPAVWSLVKSGRLRAVGPSLTKRTHAEVRDAMAEQATEVTTNTPEEFRALVRNELVKYGEVVKAVGLKAD